MKSKRDHVNWGKTLEKFGQSRIKPCPTDKVIVDCNYCDSDFEIGYRSIRSRKSGESYDGICKSCQQKRTWFENEEFRKMVSKKNSEIQKKVWTRPGYRDNQSKKQKNLTTERWLDSDYREKVIEGVKNAHATINGYTESCVPKVTPKSRERQREMTLRLWQNVEYREKTLAGIHKNWARSEFREKIAEIYKDPDYISKQKESHSSGEYLQKISEEKKKWWADNREELLEIYQSDEHRQKLRDIWKRPGFREMMSEKMRDVWKNEDLIKEVTERSRNNWKDPVYAAKCINHHSSKLEEHLAELLDGFNIKYDRQFHLGHWSFDFLVDTNPIKTLVEVQGEYWHFKRFGDQESPRDKAKATFVEKYHSNNYKLVTIWENEFLSPERLSNRLDEILGGKIEKIDFNFKDLSIKKIDGPTSSKFFSKYHYSASGGRSGINIGCFLDDKLISVCRYCSPTRKQSADRLNIKQKELKELTKFAIHPSYQKKNLATWFLSRTYCFLPSVTKMLLSFADETFGHTGTIYKAANWCSDGTLKPDYVYVDQNGFIMHKRTLWGHSKKMGMKESEYANLWGYVKMWGKEKHRFIKERRGWSRTNSSNLVD